MKNVQTVVYLSYYVLAVLRRSEAPLSSGEIGSPLRRCGCFTAIAAALCIPGVRLPRRGAEKRRPGGQRCVLKPLFGSGPVGDNDLWCHHILETLFFLSLLGSGSEGDDDLWHHHIGRFSLFLFSVRPSVRLPPLGPPAGPSSWL